MQARKCCQVICLEPLGQNCIAGDQRFHLYGVRQLVERLSCCLSMGCSGSYWASMARNAWLAVSNHVGPDVMVCWCYIVSDVCLRYHSLDKIEPCCSLHGFVMSC